jgi:hypothetical protein
MDFSCGMHSPHRAGTHTLGNGQENELNFKSLWRKCKSAKTVRRKKKKAGRGNNVQKFKLQHLGNRGGNSASQLVVGKVTKKSE